ncbi:MAG TPA: PilZ domain-containing protein [Spirochaetota bacterium]|nr:PilZ domain-containing protein [Spirochaetota bacterium]HNT10346.1 PilZ domain-containing protein [Spirochaetota bacterium]HNV47857.1 PilZ domain-containing protein [Spirochaetota bacterium]HOS40360.1 PilZ domain-containing protein [Spirochaetota bacterium]HPI23898.1 PilZ domain-containing protein [Spirochaetota bacterium]
MSKNRRQYPRIRLFRLTIKVKVKGADSFSDVELINLSAGGLCFIRNSILNFGDALILRFEFKTRQVDMIGKIVRLDGREVGVQFTCTDDEIKEFVDSFNAELSSYLIPTASDGSRLELPGYTPRPQDKKSDIDAMLDIEPQ